MNNKILDILINNSDTIFSNELFVYNKIDEILERDEVIYDGSVISVYELDKILREKMDYIKELYNQDNYIIRKDYLKNVCSYSRVDKRDLSIDVYLNSSNEVVLEFKIYLPKDFSKLIFRYCNDYDESRNRLKIVYMFYGMVIRSCSKECDEFYNIFISDNEEIISELLLILNDIYNCFDEKTILNEKFVQIMVLDKFNLRFLFDLDKKEYSCDIDFLELDNIGALGFSDYLSLKKEDIMKRIGINIKDLNPFFANEIDMYYNSINLIDYKRFVKKK